MKKMTRREAAQLVGGMGLAVGAAQAGSPAVSARTGPRDLGASEEAVRRWLELLDRNADLRSGGAAELELARITRRHLDSHGFKTSEQAFPVPTYASETCRVQFAGESLDLIPQQIVVQTPASGLAAQLAYWRIGKPIDDIKGRIVVVDLPAARHSQLRAPTSRKSLNAVLAGKPAAVILVTNGITGESIVLNAPYAKPYAPIPMTTVGPKAAATLIAAAFQGVEAILTMTGTAGRATSPNVIGRIERGTKMLVVSTPRTAWTPAVAERGPGFSAFMELARWAPKALPDRSLFFVQTTAHEYDNAGGIQFLEGPMAPRHEDVALWIHLGAGFAGRSFHDLGLYQLVPLSSVDDQRYLLGTKDTVPLLKQAFAGQIGLQNVYSEEDGAVGELAEILRLGYRPAFGMLGGHLFHHTAKDRIDKTDPRWIVAAIEAIQRVAEQVLAK